MYTSYSVAMVSRTLFRAGPRKSDRRDYFPRPSAEIFVETTMSSFVVMHPDPIQRVRLALEDIRAGRMVVLVDDEDRENEGDWSARPMRSPPRSSTSWPSTGEA